MLFFTARVAWVRSLAARIAWIVLVIFTAWVAWVRSLAARITGVAYVGFRAARVARIGYLAARVGDLAARVAFHAVSGLCNRQSYRRNQEKRRQKDSYQFRVHNRDPL
jgi:hypothetical protein